MNKARTLLTATACLLAAAAFAESTETLSKDTTRVIDIEEVMVIASPKETGKLRELPTAVSLISQKDMQARQVTSLKDISVLVPNFFMPEYGSRLTSAIYIRGIGSRINTPAVGLYVDNIPYIDKSAFDFNFYDIERIDILRGPQATLYGRNTMGGLIKVHTRSPFSYQGTDIKLGYGSKDNHRTASATHYHRWSEHFAFSAGGYYEGSDGFFRNAANGQKIDGMEAGGGRIRAIWLPSENLRLDFTVGYDYSDEGGYPYYYEGPAEGHEKENEAYKDYIGRIAYNRDCSYRRGLFNAGLNIEYQADAFVLSAVTGFQNLNDRMFLDQDFLPVDIYTLEQKQRLNTLSEEITLKSKPGKAWQWTTGAFGFYQTLRTESPVTFRKDGMTFLNETINGAFPDLSGMGMSMNLTLPDETLRVNGCFRTPVLSGALYHQSTYRIGSWEFTAGLRLEHEHTQMDYTGSCDATRFDFRLNSGRMPIALTDQEASSLLEGKLKNDYTQLLPKFAVAYRLDSRNNLYASVSKGYRSGGYNLQMFSDLSQTGLQNSIKSGINQGVGNRLDKFAQMGMPSTVISMIKGMMDTYLAPQDIDVREATVYKPEYSWNYELGSHLTLCKGKLQADVAVFYMDTHDQQIAKFVNSGMGRITVNAGRSESYGAEASLLASISRSLNLNAGYGYTRSTFKRYDGGITSADETIDYSGHYVPFVPRHTLNAGGSYSFFFPRSRKLQSLTLGLDYTGAGKIYWTEKNDAVQDFYGTLNGRISLQAQAWQVTLWGHNLTDTDYTTFYFESMSRGFAQKSKPMRFGVDLQYRF